MSISFTIITVLSVCACIETYMYVHTIFRRTQRKINVCYICTCSTFSVASSSDISNHSMKPLMHLSTAWSMHGQHMVEPRTKTIIFFLKTVSPDQRTFFFFQTIVLRLRFVSEFSQTLYELQLSLEQETTTFIVWIAIVCIRSIPMIYFFQIFGFLNGKRIDLLDIDLQSRLKTMKMYVYVYMYVYMCEFNHELGLEWL